LYGRQGDEIFTRRLSNPLITFYDLAQVNTGSAASPVWADHDILRVPDFTADFMTWGINYFLGVSYTVDPFESADFAALTAKMFDVGPVTEWNRLFRKIEMPATGDDFETDLRISIRDSATVFPNEKFLPTVALNNAAADPVTKETYLSVYRWLYDRARQGVIERGLNELRCNWIPRGFFNERVESGYFGFSTGTKDFYKVTDVYDPEAPDVGTLAPGDAKIECYLMPQVGFWAATANSSDWKTTDVLGMHYQVQPRKWWPRYLEGTVQNAFDYGSDEAVENFMAYQAARDGVRARTWTFTGTVGTYDHDFTETALDPGDWTALPKWGAATLGCDSSAVPDGSFFGLAARGYTISDNTTNYWTEFKSTEDENFGETFFRTTEPFLTAVLKWGGRFYYVWDVGNAGGSFSAFQTYGQRDRFRLSRGIEWEPGYIDSVPPQMKDGSGPFYDI
jgi:hypothetical protein